ncbi:MAG: leucine-rich repeat protein [Clostridia bacterium]|nr:leucine-rich repeat protein [Clostridia bacterium]
MRKILAISLFLILILAVGSAEEIAQGSWNGLDWTLTDDGTLTFTSSWNDNLNGWADPFDNQEAAAAARHIVVGEGITTLSGEVFTFFPSLEEVTLSTDVTSISWNAFSGSTISSLTIPSSVTEIEPSAFVGSSLESILVDGENPAYASVNGSLYSKDLSTLLFLLVPDGQRVDIPDGVQSILPFALDSCTSVETIGIPASLTSVPGNLGVTRFSVTAYDVDEDNPAYQSVNGVIYDKAGTTIVAVPRGLSGVFEIPVGVTAIGDISFCNCQGLTGVIIPAGVTSVGNSAFDSCSALTEIALPDTVTFIDSGAFEFCSALTSFTVPDGVSRIESSTFVYCTALTTVCLPAGLTSIGEWAFDNCSSLTDVYFAGTRSQWNAIPIPEGNDRLAVCRISCIDDPPATPTDLVVSGDCGASTHWWFEEDGTLTVYGSGSIDWTDWYEYTDRILNVRILEGPTAIAPGVFSNLLSVTGISLPNSLTTIGDSAFRYCNLTTLHIPAGVTQIGDNAFDGNFYLIITVDENNQFYCSDEGVIYDKAKTNLMIYPCSKQTKQYTLPDTLEVVSTGAFHDNGWLEILTVPGDSVSFRYDAIGNCRSLTIACHEGSTAQAYAQAQDIPYVIIANSGSCGDNVEWAFADGLLTVTGTGPIAYDSLHAPWYTHQFEIEQVIFGEGITQIPTKAFYGCSALTQISLPSTLTEIGESAFEACTQLSGVTLPESLTTLRRFAFWNTAMTEVAIPADVTVIEEGVFAWNEHLTSITVAQGNSAFTVIDGILYTADVTKVVACPKNKDLTGYTIPQSVTVIGGSAFRGNSSLTALVLHEGVQVIGERAFMSCGSLTQITFPAGLQSIEANAFCMAALTEAVLPDGLQTIGRYAFNNCMNLTSASVPGSVQVLGEGSFGYCELLQTVVLGEGLTALENYVFQGCSSLTNLSLPVSLTAIGEYAFSYNDQLTDVTYAGLPEQWAGIAIGQGNGSLDLAIIHFSDGSQSGISWNLDENGVLTVGGIGRIPDYDWDDSLWHPQSDAIRSVVIEDGITAIGASAFSGSWNLADVTIASSVTSIGRAAFQSTALTEVSIPASVQSIGDGAFGYIQTLTAFRVAEDNPVYASVDGVLMNKEQTRLISYPAGKTDSGYDVPIGVTVIDPFAFSASRNLYEVTIPQGVTEIQELTFEMSGLERIVLPEGVTRIGGYAFSQCWDLRSIEIPASVTLIGEYAFEGCENLSVVYYGGSAEDWSTIVILTRNADLLNAFFYYDGVFAAGEMLDWFGNPAGFNWTLARDGTLNVYGVGQMPDWIGVLDGSGGELLNPVSRIIVNEGITGIGSGSFGNIDSPISEMLLPDSLTTLHYMALAGGPNNISLSANVTLIDDGAFDYSNACVTVDADNPVYASLNGSLYSKDMTTLIYWGNTHEPGTIDIPEGVTSVRPYAFHSCFTFTGLSIPSSLTDFGGADFTNMSALAEITVAEDHPAFTVIDNVLYNREGTRLILCPKGAQNEASAFVIPDGVESIGPQAFYNLNGVTIPNSVTVIEAGAFERCYELYEIRYEGTKRQWNAILIESPNGNVGYDSVLTYIVSQTYILPADLTVIESGAFTGLPAETVIRIPDSVVSIAADAFDSDALLLVPAGSQWVEWALANGYVPVEE